MSPPPDTGLRVELDSEAPQKQAQALAKPEIDPVEDNKSEETSIRPMMSDVALRRPVRMKKIPAWRDDYV